MSAASILVVEDDVALSELLTWNLSAEGYDVRSTPDGEEALVMVREQTPDAIVLDWMIEQVPGIEVCRQLRKDKETASVPIIMLTARGEEEDMIRGLKTGADDYVTKPFSPRELMARIEALLRRARPSLAGSVLSWGDIELDATSHRVRRGGEALHLGPTEFRLLRYFMERPNRVVSRQQILDGVWGMDSDIDERTVDVHIRRLRKAINRDGETDPIRTVRAAGYAMDVA
ncbi:MULTISPECIES: phosphate regulon transcriptional regulator PhoB [Sphingomonadaceae]|uniref:Phosphate regulon transcriptional regulatory protein PhoB n=1 Tax=Novosphingobium resinovorum TaxID=158500 RepID=A0A031JYF0_9SPHN|nr:MULTISPECIES: phosphate regulon transcriptional regulator PhoB [Sphingomonadaceae]AOR77035.1 phosphate regulon transcriptional regulatory protein PhoB [Novosphingobium resinovorum]EJU14386.1 two-component system OmpR family phosphate regulon response regulator PhoB [Sphingomonas sp. LH128]EZP81397.1 Two-component system OmpR family phosphate regulon response regulator PhoB [Novosphingobium resinovorum]MBF7012420.1 phosphate regulon transcriptional regulator PhoB [Novosphingobium sp. HR1a]ME